MIWALAYIIRIEQQHATRISISKRDPGTGLGEYPKLYTKYTLVFKSSLAITNSIRFLFGLMLSMKSLPFEGSECSSSDTQRSASDTEDLQKPMVVSGTCWQ